MRIILSAVQFRSAKSGGDMATLCFALLLSLVTARGGSATGGSGRSGSGSGSGPLDIGMMSPMTGSSVIMTSGFSATTSAVKTSAIQTLTLTAAVISTPTTDVSSPTVTSRRTITSRVTLTESSSSTPITQTPSPTLSSTIETLSTLGPSVTETLTITPLTESSIPVTQTPSPTSQRKSISPTLTVQSGSPVSTPGVFVTEEGDGEEVGMPDKWVLFLVAGVGGLVVLLLLLAVIIMGVRVYRTRR